MNYVYDIVLNFNKKLYDFFEWNFNDDLIHIKKIPIFKLSNDDYFNLKNCYVFVDNSFLHRIYKKTDLFTKNGVNDFYFSCLITNCSEIIALKFNKKGNIIAKSCLLIEEENEILDFTSEMNVCTLKYKVISHKNSFSFSTRYEENFRRNCLLFLNKLKFDKNIDLVNYLFFECFDRYESNFNKAISCLKNAVVNNFYSVYDVLNNFLKISDLKSKKVYNFD